MTAPMLARVANTVYWMSRYVERAENTARFIDVNLQLTLDRTGGINAQWMPLVSIAGAEKAFIERYKEPTRDNVLHFLTLDPDYPNSIFSCVAAARENARTVRETITTEMWEQVNELYHVMRNAQPEFLSHHFYRGAKRTAMLFTAITDNAMSRTLGWDFAQLGRMLERADNTSRILDVKYFLLLPTPEDVGSNLDVIQWRALLHSTDALEMYRQTYGPITPRNVADFLVLNRDFPRSMAFCLYRAARALTRIRGDDAHHSPNLVRRRLGQLQSDLEYATIDEVIGQGMHEYLDGFQTRLNQIGDAVNAAFFQPRDREEAEPSEPKGTPAATS